MGPRACLWPVNERQGGDTYKRSRDQGRFLDPPRHGQWVTSTYWINQRPQWAVQFNASDRAEVARKESGATQGNFYEIVGRSAASVRYQLDFARALIAGERLGENTAGVMDMITISVSSTDINGHAFGPDDLSQRSLIERSNVALGGFFRFLDETLGLRNVMVAMTGDHGVATTQKAGDAMGMPVLDFSSDQFTKQLEQMLETKYPLKSKRGYVLQMDNPYLLLNRKAFEAAGVDEEEAENIARGNGRADL